jgi:hypothetical protein
MRFTNSKNPTLNRNGRGCHQAAPRYYLFKFKPAAHSGLSNSSRKAQLMRRFLFALGTLAISATAHAETSPFKAFTEAVNSGSIEECLAAFAPGARFIDLGNDFSAPDRMSYFCKAVVDAGSRYTVLTETQEGETISFTFDFKQAGGYALNGKGSATISGGKIGSMMIEAR